MDEQKRREMQERLNRINTTVEPVTTAPDRSEMQSRLDKVLTPVEKETTHSVPEVSTVSPKPVIKMGIIESNRQILRNESGQAKHKEFTGVYETKPMDMPIGEVDLPAPFTPLPKPSKTRTKINWIAWAIGLVILAVIGEIIWFLIN